MNLTALIILCIYLLIVLAIGFYFRNKDRDLPAFLVAGRSMPAYVVGATIAATVIGGSATIVSTSLIYSHGLAGLWMDIGAILGLIVLAVFLARRVRRLEKLTLPDMVGDFYGGKARFTASILVIMAEIAWAALLLQASQLFITTIIGFEKSIILGGYELNIVLLITAIVFISYTVLGGQRAVSYTDVFQLVMMIGGITLILTPAALYFTANNGGIHPGGDFFSFPTSVNLGWMAALSYVIMMGFSHAVGSDIYSKVLSAKDEKAARKGTILAVVFKSVFVLSLVLLCVCGLSILKADTPAVLVLPNIVNMVLPVGLAALVGASFVAVMMSSADTVLFTAGSVVVNDIIRPLRTRFTHSPTSNRNAVLHTRVALVIIGIFSVILAVVINDIIETLEYGYTIFSAGVVPPVLFGLFRDRIHITKYGAIAGFIGGGGSALFWKIFMAELFPELARIDAVVAGLLICMLLLFGVSLFTKNDN